MKEITREHVLEICAMLGQDASRVLDIHIGGRDSSDDPHPNHGYWRARVTRRSAGETFGIERVYIPIVGPWDRAAHTESGCPVQQAYLLREDALKIIGQRLADGMPAQVAYQCEHNPHFWHTGTKP